MRKISSAQLRKTSKRGAQLCAQRRRRAARKLRIVLLLCLPQGAQFLLNLCIDLLLAFAARLHLGQGAIHIAGAHRAIVLLVQVAQLKIELDLLQSLARILLALAQGQGGGVAGGLLQRGPPIERIEHEGQDRQGYDGCNSYRHGLHLLSSLPRELSQTADRPPPVPAQAAPDSSQALDRPGTARRARPPLPLVDDP